MNIDQNITLFQEMISCGDNLYTWAYDEKGNLLHSNCPEESLYASAFSFLGCQDKAFQLAQNRQTPAIIGTGLGLIWGVDFVRDNYGQNKLYVVGPAFFTDVSLRDIEKGFQAYGDISLSFKHQMLREFSQIPVSQNVVFSRYLLMLHYCLTGEKLSVSDLIVYSGKQPSDTEKTDKDRHKIWTTEQAMLQMVRNGDLNYKNALNASMLISSGVPVKGSDPLRQAKTSTIVFTSIVCRAAIEGGLSPEEAYSVGDNYIQNAESAKTYDDVAAIPILMYDDFVRRVNKCRRNPRVSPSIQKCIDFIEMHLDQKIRARDLAELAGYTEYYLTHKFKEETGFCVNDYVKKVKVERAKILLRTTTLSIQDIADQLSFGTRSYFSRVFSEFTNCSPVEYRNK